MIDVKISMGGKIEAKIQMGAPQSKKDNPILSASITPQSTGNLTDADVLAGVGIEITETEE